MKVCRTCKKEILKENTLEAFIEKNRLKSLEELFLMIADDFRDFADM